ncbi:MAG: FAD-binding protein [bacterium]|nr:FAD-binding protein [bacterium]
MGKEVSKNVFDEWKAILGKGVVLEGEIARSRYGRSTLDGVMRSIRGALLPKSVEEIVSIVKVASKYRVPIYPISAGRNWGYGSSNPVDDNCVILDMSRMNTIIALDESLGLVTVEPGVTYRQLEEYLESKNSLLLAPCSGGGPSCSLIGNALERGRSISAPIDRFASITALEVVLADGSIYRSPFSQPGSSFSGFYKWGIGPYLDGIFGQSNLGIVVKATFALSRKPEYTQCFIVSVKESESIAGAVDAARNLLNKLGSTLPSIVVQNPQRTFSRTINYPRENRLKNGVLSDDFIKESLQQLLLTKWTILGFLQGDARIVKTAQDIVNEEFNDTVGEVLFFDAKTLRTCASIKRYMWIPKRTKRIVAILPILYGTLSGVTGRGIKRNLDIPFWTRMSDLSPDDISRLEETNFDYDADPRCGILFFTAVLPMVGANVERFADMAENICKKHHMEPFIGFLNSSDRCMAVNMPLFFDKSDEKQVKSSQLCYRELFDMTLECGGHLQRANIDSMNMIANPEDGFWKTGKKVKDALDPHNIISPGRYASNTTVDKE